MASHWAEYATHKEYTNLQYHTALDDKVRESHAALEGITLPYEDPFWNTAFPPNGWNCRCHVVPVLKEDYPVSDSQTAQQSFEMLTEGSEIFRFNPGKEAVIFPPHHPYYGKHGYQHCINPHLALSLEDDPSDPCLVYQKIKEAEEVVKPTPLGKVLIEKTKDGHTIQRYENVDTEASDYKQVLSVARYFAKRGEDVELLPKMDSGSKAFDYKEIFADLIGTRYENKTPDLRCTKDGVSVYREVKGYEEGTNGKNALRNMFGDALKQSDKVVLKRHPEWTERWLKRSIEARIKRGAKITEVWLQEENGELTLLYKSTEGQPFN